MSDQAVGAYRLLDKLGVGGMGEVFRAHDSKLKRDVAIKVLPSSFAADPERVARFEREAQVLAALNHPNIAAIYGLEGGESGQPRALVMELVEGPTLAELLVRVGAPNRGLPLPEARAIARQIIDALEAAHERGIVHRDLKPANIKVRDDGTVKVLDFGLAKALDPSGGSGEIDPMNSPTLTARSTQLGVILGTAAYMSPEQAKGRQVDKRADIWAFGAVFYEMLTGRRAFAGEDVSDTLASVLRQDVDWQALPPETPSTVRRLLARCLERDLKRRLRDIGDARVDLDDGEPAPTPVVAPGPSVRAPLALRLLPWIAGLVIAGAGVGWGLLRVPSRQADTVTRTEIKLTNLDLFLRLSHDGSRLTYSTVMGQGNARVGLRLMSELAGKPVSGAEGAFSILSPDGQWIAYQSLGADSRLLKIPTNGGAPVPLCEGALIGGGDWGPDDTIVFASAAGLRRVSANGGTPETLTTVDAAKGETGHSFPRFLPDGKRILFTVATKSSGDQFAVLDLGTRTYRVIAPGGDNGQYQRGGYLTFVRNSTLFAVPFDLSRLTVTGPVVPVIEGILKGADGVADYTASDNGLLMYASQTGGQGTTLAWLDRKGAVTPFPGLTRAQWGSGRLAPDGTRVANTIAESDGSTDVWVIDATRGTTTRLSTVGHAVSPIWTPDGRRIIFASVHDHRTVLYTVPADNSGTASALISLDSVDAPSAVSPDGRTLLIESLDKSGNARLLRLTLGPAGIIGSPQPWHETTATEGHADYSPNGQWVAYESDQSGNVDVYVQAASGTGARVRVSEQGGRSPRWARNGRELFYWVSLPGSRLMGVDVTPGATFSPGAPHSVADILSGTTWDVSPDPNRFLVELTTATGGSTLVMVTDWFDELRRLAPSKR